MNEPKLTIVANDPEELEKAMVDLSVGMLRNPHVVVRLAVDQRLVAEGADYMPCPPGYDPVFFHAWAMGFETAMLAMAEGWINFRVVKTYEE